MKQKLNHSLLLAVFFCSSQALFSQSVSLLGAHVATTGTRETYTVSSLTFFDPNTVITWTVSGGTIITQITDPTAFSIYCTVQWSNNATNGNVVFSESIGGGVARKAVYVTSNPSIVSEIVSPLITRPSINCSSINGSCNFIQNNNFTPTFPHDSGDPFTNNQVSPWVATHGSPQIIDPWNPTPTPPNPATGFAYMYASYFPNQPNHHLGEGIAQKLPEIFYGSNYTLSFFMRYAEWGDPAPQLDEFYVVLAKCSDINNFPTNSYNIPPLPTNSQVVYLGTSITNTSWQQVTVTFTADDNYDMIWMFPKQNQDNAGVTIAYPMLSQAGNVLYITPNGTSNVCTPWEYAPTNTVLLTSTTSSSGQYQWYKDGQAISGATSQTHYAQHNQQGIYVRTHTYTVQNPVSGCPTIPVTINFVPTPLPSPEGYGNLQKGVWHTIQTTENLSPATYSWNIPGATISDQNINDQYVDVFFPTNSPSPVTGYVTINGQASCANNTYTYDFLLSSHIVRDRVGTNEPSIRNKPSVFPNPANLSTTITYKYPITKIELFNSAGFLIKQYPVNHQKQVEISLVNIPGGVYSCRIYSAFVTETIKLAIQKQ